MARVPFLDISRQFRSLQPELEAAVSRVLGSGRYVQGGELDAFERSFAEYLGVAEAVGVSSGTAAISCVLRALGIGPGDEVITVPNTFIATAEAVSLVGARPLFVDVDPVTQLIDVRRIRGAITANTKAIIPVHLFGQCADMDAIMAIARERGITVIEDACQAHGSLYKGRKAGSLGHAACFSFYPGKNLGTCGEGGAVVTDNPELAEKVRKIRNHGSKVKYHHELLGGNYRLGELEAAVLRVKLPHLDEWNERRRGHARHYQQVLAGAPVAVLRPSADTEPNYHLFVIESDSRDELQKFLEAEGIDSGIHYPVPIHLQDVYRNLGLGVGSFPVAERLAKRILSLPMYPELEPTDIETVAEKVHSFFRSR